MGIEDKVTSTEQQIVSEISAIKADEQKAVTWWDQHRSTVQLIAIGVALVIIAAAIALHRHA